MQDLIFKFQNCRDYRRKSIGDLEELYRFECINKERQNLKINN